jgi:hypothetical protein
MNPFGILTNMGASHTPQYNTFTKPGKHPYGLPPGVSPRELHYNHWQNGGIERYRWPPLATHSAHEVLT